MGHYIIFVILVTLASCEARIMRVREGDIAKLDFSYSCNSTRITLQYGYRAPCYSSANPASLAMPANQKLQLENGNDSCSIHLTINPVLRDDEGTYILTAYKNGVMLPDYPRIGLRVDYPPGKASCESSNDFNGEDWVTLRCTAPLGTLPGLIVCYQNGLRLPPFTNPEQTDRIIAQTLLARFVDTYVFCCSALLEERKNECECNDFGWDPSRKTALTEINGPCPTQLSFTTQDPTSSNTLTGDVQMDSSNSTLPTKIPEKTTFSCDNKSLCSSMHRLILVVVILIIINIILSAGHVFKTWKIEKSLRNLGNLDTSDVIQNLRSLVKENENVM